MIDLRKTLLSTGKLYTLGLLSLVLILSQQRGAMAVNIQAMSTATSQEPQETQLVQTPTQTASQYSFRQQVEMALDKVLALRETESYMTMCFVLGCILLPYSIVFMVKNEMKIVQMVKLLTQAQTDCKTIDNVTDMAIAKDNDLVCVSGTSFSKNDLFDKEFGVVAEDSYRLKRKVEMYQWQEVKRPGAGGEQDPVCTNEKVWSEHSIDSSKFHEQGYKNPTADKWAFKSKNFVATNVELGNYKLNQSQCKRLGNQKMTIDWTDDDKEALENTVPLLKSKGYSSLKTNGSFLTATCGERNKRKSVKESLHTPQIGQIRVYFEYEICGPTTVIAQQTQDDKGRVTFRTWNLNGQGQASDEKEQDGNKQEQVEPSFFHNLFCCIGVPSPETIDYVEDDTVSFQKFTNQEWGKVWSNRCAMRLMALGVMLISLFQLMKSKRLDTQLEKVPVWAPLKTNFNE